MREQPLPKDIAPWNLDLPGLEGWAARQGEPPEVPEAPWGWSDNDGGAARSLDAEGRRVILRMEGLASALVDTETRQIFVFDVADGDVDVRPWVRDHVAPRLLSHLGSLVVHAGAVLAEEGRSLLVTAPSGWGKSTLTAFLHQAAGWPLLGDDAILLRPDAGEVLARTVYPRLKLRSDSWAHLYPAGAALRPDDGWKFSLDLSDRPGVTRDDAPLGLVVSLAPPAPDGVARLRPLGAAELCMALVRNSFALDPSDRARAAQRFAIAAQVANGARGFELSYARDFGQLADVLRMLREQA